MLKETGEAETVSPQADENALLIAFFSVAKRSEAQLAETLKRLELTAPLADLLHLLDPAAPPRR